MHLPAFGYTADLQPTVDQLWRTPLACL